MNQSIAILNSRVNGQGFTGAKVQQQGSNLIVVSVPGKSAEEISPLLSSRGAAVPPGAAGSRPGAPTALASAGLPARRSARHSPSPSSSPSPGGVGLAEPVARRPRAAAARRQERTRSALPATPRRQAAPTPIPVAVRSASPSGAASPSPSPSPSLTKRLATAADASGDITKVTSKAVIADFNKLNCANKNWQKQIYGDNRPAGTTRPSRSSAATRRATSTSSTWRRCWERTSPRSRPAERAEPVGGQLQPGRPGAEGLRPADQHDGLEVLRLPDGQTATRCSTSSRSCWTARSCPRRR